MCRLRVYKIKFRKKTGNTGLYDIQSNKTVPLRCEGSCLFWRNAAERTPLSGEKHIFGATISGAASAFFLPLDKELPERASAYYTVELTLPHGTGLKGIIAQIPAYSAQDIEVTLYHEIPRNFHYALIPSPLPVCLRCTADQLTLFPCDIRLVRKISYCFAGRKISRTPPNSVGNADDLAHGTVQPSLEWRQWWNFAIRPPLRQASTFVLLDAFYRNDDQLMEREEEWTEIKLLCLALANIEPGAAFAYVRGGVMRRCERAGGTPAHESRLCRLHAGTSLPSPLLQLSEGTR